MRKIVIFFHFLFRCHFGSIVALFELTYRQSAFFAASVGEKKKKKKNQCFISVIWCPKNCLSIKPLFIWSINDSIIQNK